MSARSPKDLANDGLLAGLLAGLIFMVVQMIALSADAPWRLFSSIVITQPAFTRSFNIGIFVAGFVVHVILCLIYGATFAGLSRLVPARRRGLPAMATLGVAFGFALWVLNFPICGHLFFGWVLRTRMLAEMFLHLFGFGLPLGAGLWMLEQARGPWRSREHFTTLTG